MKTPAALKQGDKIGIVAPAKKTSEKELAPAIQLMESWGLEVVFGKHLYAAHNQFAGNDAERAEDLQTMLDDASIKAIINVRGGYGTVRIIDKIDFSTFLQNPKWVVGFSDITILHSHIHNLGVETLHATMPINMELNNEDKKIAVETLRKSLFGETYTYPIAVSPLNKKGVAEGELVGGNLSILYSLIASKSDIDTTGKILFIEDLDEYLYHIDRMMMSLKRAGKLKNLAGLVVGGMTAMNDNKIPFGKTAEEIILDAVEEYNYPVAFNFPAGHIDNNQAMVLGKKMKLEVDLAVSLK